MLNRYLKPVEWQVTSYDPDIMYKTSPRSPKEELQKSEIKLDNPETQSGTDVLTAKFLMRDAVLSVMGGRKLVQQLVRKKKREMRKKKKPCTRRTESLFIIREDSDSEEYLSNQPAPKTRKRLSLTALASKDSSGSVDILADKKPKGMSPPLAPPSRRILFATELRYSLSSLSSGSLSLDSLTSDSDDSDGGVGMKPRRAPKDLPKAPVFKNKPSSFLPPMSPLKESGQRADDSFKTQLKQLKERRRSMKVEQLSGKWVMSTDEVKAVLHRKGKRRKSKRLPLRLKTM